ncbi:MAG: hypothetical protein VXW65_03530 [Pseudomonadota bacterium]|nr:hypothetical protein [Pseudomonadota bacterium]
MAATDEDIKNIDVSLEVHSESLMTTPTQAPIWCTQNTNDIEPQPIAQAAHIAQLIRLNAPLEDILTLLIDLLEQRTDFELYDKMIVEDMFEDALMSTETQHLQPLLTYWQKYIQISAPLVDDRIAKHVLYNRLHITRELALIRQTHFNFFGRYIDKAWATVGLILILMIGGFFYYFYQQTPIVEAKQQAFEKALNEACQQQQEQQLPCSIDTYIKTINDVRNTGNNGSHP